MQYRVSMIIDDLRIVLEFSRSGHLRDVARNLQLDETTVSRRLTRLEQDLGVRLLDRERQGWRLTDAGERVLRHAEAVESTRIAAMNEFVLPGAALSGTVRILAPDGFGAYVLIPGLRGLREQHPELSLEVSTSTTHDAPGARDFDLAISLEEISHPSLTVEPLADYHLRLYASHEYLVREGTPESIPALSSGHSLIWYIDSMLDVEPLRLVDTLLPGARAMVQCNNITGQLLAAKSGLGIAPLPTYIGDQDPELVCVLPSEFSARRRYWLVVPENGVRLHRVQAAVASIRGIVAGHPELVGVVG